MHHDLLLRGVGKAIQGILLLDELPVGCHLVSDLCSVVLQESVVGHRGVGVRYLVRQVLLNASIPIHFRMWLVHLSFYLAQSLKIVALSK